MIHLEGVEHFAVSAELLFSKLADAGFLAGCLPDAEVIEASPDRASWKVKPKIAFLSGTIDTTATVLDRVPGTAVKYELDSKSVGAGNIVEATLTLLPADGGGTTVQWSGDITKMTGLMKLAPKSLIQGTATKVIADVWNAIRAKL